VCFCFLSGFYGRLWRGEDSLVGGDVKFYLVCGITLESLQGGEHQHLNESIWIFSFPFFWMEVEYFSVYFDFF